MRDLHDLRSDWQRWTPSERLFGVLTLTAIFIAASLPFLIEL
jgi:hypothetical protein